MTGNVSVKYFTNIKPKQLKERDLNKIELPLLNLNIKEN